MNSLYAPPRVVIVLASHELTPYVDLTCAAHDFVAATNPHISTALVLDRRTARFLRSHRPQLLQRFDEVVVDEHEEASVKAASRALKLRTRRLISGDFLYLDCDAFVIDRLDEVFRLPDDVTFTRDMGMEQTNFTTDNIWVREHEQLGWQVTSRHYNGGVFLARDTSAAHAFFDAWWDRWRTFQATGRCVDQPALDQAIHSGVAKVGELPPRFNAVFAVEPRHVRRAAVLHFLVSNATLSTTVLDQILAEVRDEGRVRPATIDRLRATRYPWRDENLPRRQYYAGNYGKAFRAAGVRCLSSVLGRRATS
jgi:hypothetical protein